MSNEEQNKLIGIEKELKIQVLKNGTVSVVAPSMHLSEVRLLLMDALMSVQEDAAVNKALGLLAQYMDNVQGQHKIIGAIKGN